MLKFLYIDYIDIYITEVRAKEFSHSQHNKRNLEVGKNTTIQESIHQWLKMDHEYTLLDKMRITPLRFKHAHNTLKSW